MAATDRLTFLPPAMPSGLGCALVFPAALFGTLMLADYSGPGGWRGLAEFIGWWTVSIGASVGCEALVARFRAKRRGRFFYLLAAVLVACGLFALVIYEVQPATPLSVKLLATTSLQFIGVVGGLALLCFVVWFALNSRKT